MSEAETPSTPDRVRGAQLRALKARGQLLNPVVKVGKAGLTDAFYAALDEALNHHELVKLKFDEFKEQKKELVPQIVARSGAQLIQRVGNVAVLFRRRDETAKPASRAGV